MSKTFLRTWTAPEGRPEGLTAAADKALAFLWLLSISECDPAPPQRNIHNATMSFFRRQKIITTAFVTNRHKTVRVFFDEF
ncbi:hypothetical protein [Pseudomonas sp. Teo4]|uniref:hypothetical protein n=1 Tax=Pseudomonas sp. Teo4 TaxID=3064528 RepID=UPI002ACB0F6F|nr:hypothetical protein [Pseudomonas sp. Teo4]